MSKIRSTVLFEKCCFRVNTKRGNYIFGIVNLLLRFAFIAPVWDLSSTFDEEENGYRFFVKATSVWLLASCFAVVAMMYGIWNYQPMHVLPFLIVIYCECAAAALLSVGLAALFGSEAKIAYLASALTIGWILTGAYLYYSFVLYRMYKQMLANPLARYIYIS